MLNLNGARESRLQNELTARAFGVQGQRDHFCYGPYGYQAANQAQTLLRFNGQCIEPMSQGYLLGNGHRLYQPRLCRFHSPDALSPFGDGGFNCYAYCSGDPINRIDPSGRKGTGLTALITKHGLNKKLARKELKKMPIPEQDIHSHRQGYAEEDGRTFIVYRDSKGRFAALPQPDPESRELKRLIEDGWERIAQLADRVLAHSRTAIRNRNLLSGGTVLARVKQPQGLEALDHSRNAVDSKALLTGGAVLVKNARQGFANSEEYYF